MVSTIARIAGKPATSLWPPAVVRYLADEAGLENEAIARLQSAVIAVCSQAFEHLTADHPQLEIAFTRFSDRIEVALRHLGDDPPAVGLDAIAGFASHGTGSIQVVFAGFDRVQYETRRGAGVTLLTKYIGQATRK